MRAFLADHMGPHFILKHLKVHSGAQTTCDTRFNLESPFWKNKSAGIMRLLILTEVITYIINFSYLHERPFACKALGEISISDRGTQVQRLRITIKNTTGVTSQCKPSGSAYCQTWNPEPPAGSPQCTVDITTHPWQTRNNTCGKEEFGKKKWNKKESEKDRRLSPVINLSSSSPSQETQCSKAEITSDKDCRMIIKYSTHGSKFNTADNSAICFLRPAANLLYIKQVTFLPARLST